MVRSPGFAAFAVFGSGPTKNRQRGYLSGQSTLFVKAAFAYWQRVYFLGHVTGLFSATRSIRHFKEFELQVRASLSTASFGVSGRATGADAGVRAASGWLSCP